MQENLLRIFTGKYAGFLSIFVSALVFGVLLSALALGETGQALRLQNLAALILVCAGIFAVNASNNSLLSKNKHT